MFDKIRSLSDKKLGILVSLVIGLSTLVGTVVGSCATSKAVVEAARVEVEPRHWEVLSDLSKDKDIPLEDRERIRDKLVKMADLSDAEPNNRLRLIRALGEHTESKKNNWRVRITVPPNDFAYIVGERDRTAIYSHDHRSKVGYIYFVLEDIKWPTDARQEIEPLILCDDKRQCPENGKLLQRWDWEGALPSAPAEYFIRNPNDIAIRAVVRIHTFEDLRRDDRRNLVLTLTVPAKDIAFIEEVGFNDPFPDQSSKVIYRHNFDMIPIIVIHKVLDDDIGDLAPLELRNHADQTILGRLEVREREWCTVEGLLKGQRIELYNPNDQTLHLKIAVNDRVLTPEAGPAVVP